MSVWISVREAAERAKVSKKTVYEAAKREDLRVARIGAGRSIRTTAAWVDAWLEAISKGGPPQKSQSAAA